MSSSQFNLLPLSPAVASPPSSKKASLHSCYGAGIPGTPEAIIRPSHVEDHGKVLILEAKPLNQDPVLLNLGLAPSSLCHTASPCQPFPNQIVSSWSLGSVSTSAFPGHDPWSGQLTKAARPTWVSSLKPWVWVLILYMQSTKTSMALTCTGHCSKCFANISSVNLVILLIFNILLFPIINSTSQIRKLRKRRG